MVDRYATMTKRKRQAKPNGSGIQSWQRWALVAPALAAAAPVVEAITHLVEVLAKVFGGAK